MLVLAINMTSLNEISPAYLGTFTRQRKLMPIVGISIFEESERSFIRKYGRLIVFSSMLVFMFVSQILYFTKRKELGANFLDVVSAVPSFLVVIQNLSVSVYVLYKELAKTTTSLLLLNYTSSGISDMVKLYAAVTRKNEILELILEIGKLFKFDYENIEKNEEMKSCIRRLKIWNDVMFGGMAVAFTIFGLVPLVVTVYRCYTDAEPGYTFIVEMYFFNRVDSLLTYLIAVAYQLTTCSLCQMCIYIPCDYLILNLSFSISAFLKLVQIDLLNLKGTSNLERLDFYGGDNCEDITIIVKTHQMLLSLAARLNKIFEETIFSQVYLSSMIICCYLFTAVNQTSKYGVAPILGLYVASIIILVEIFILAVPGQVIADTSSSIADAAYQCPWYERSYKFRKCVAIVIVRSQKPFYLSALGFSDLTLVMFSKVVSTTWSYLSLLNQMTEDLDV